MNLSAQALERHKRHIMLKEIGGPGVQKLRAAQVSLVGAGALGGPCALYLAAAGVGTLELWDDDCVERSNLQRQIQFSECDIGQPKVTILAERLAALNPDVTLRPRQSRFGSEDTLTGQIIIDATDNYQSRYQLNTHAHSTARYLVSGAASGWSGQVAVFASGVHTKAPCYRCFVPQMPPDAEACDEVGVVGALTGLVASAMAMETVKLITGAGTPLWGYLNIYDGLSGQMRTLRLRANKSCPVCQT